METLDKKIIFYLSKGKTQSEISKILKETGFEPSSLRLIEKRIGLMKKEHEAISMFQLGVILTKKQLT